MRRTLAQSETLGSAPYGRLVQNTVYVEDYGAVGYATPTLALAGTDSAAAFNAAIAAVFAAGVADGSFYGRVVCKAKNYLIGGALQQGGTPLANAQIPLPFTTGTSGTKFVLDLEGVVGGFDLYGLQVNPSATGTRLISNLAGKAYDATYGKPCVIGGPDAAQIATFSSLMFRMTNIHVQVPANPTIGGINLEYVAQCDIEKVTVTTGEPPASVTTPTNKNAFGILFPRNNNNAYVTGRKLAVVGLYAAYGVSEHSELDGIVAYKCVVALAPYNSTAHASVIVNASLEWCNYYLAYYDPTSAGVTSLGSGQFTLDIQNLDIEEGSSPWATVNHVVDPSNKFHGRIFYQKVIPNTGPIKGALNVLGATGLQLVNKLDNGPGWGRYTFGSYGKTPVVRPLLTTVDAASLTAALASLGLIVQPTVTDTFTRGDSALTLGTSDSSHAWTALAGTWGISSNQGYYPGANGVGFAVVDSTLADAIVSCDITLSATSNRAEAGLTLRAADVNNLLMVELVKLAATGSNNTLNVWKKVAGTFTLLATTGNSLGLTNGTTYTLRCEMVGNSLAFFLNGVFKLAVTLTSAEQTTFGANTKHGLELQKGSAANDDAGTRFDNFYVAAAGS